MTTFHDQPPMSRRAAREFERRQEAKGHPVASVATAPAPESQVVPDAVDQRPVAPSTPVTPSPSAFAASAAVPASAVYAPDGRLLTRREARAARAAMEAELLPPLVEPGAEPADGRTGIAAPVSLPQVVAPREAPALPPEAATATSVPVVHPESAVVAVQPQSADAAPRPPHAATASPAAVVSSEAVSPEPVSPAAASPVEPQTAESAPESVLSVSSVQSVPVASAPIQSAPVQSAPVQSVPVQSEPPQSAPVRSVPVPSAPARPASAPAPVIASTPLTRPAVIEPAVTEAELAPSQPERVAALPIVEPAADAQPLDDDATESPFRSFETSDVSGSSISTSALVLPSIPGHTDLPRALDGTGEILITGTLNLPTSLAETGSHYTGLDGVEVDRLLEADDRVQVSTSSQPVRATRAVSTHTATRGIIQPKRPKTNRLLTALAITASALAVGVVALLLVGVLNGLF